MSAFGIGARRSHSRYASGRIMQKLSKSWKPTMRTTSWIWSGWDILRSWRSSGRWRPWETRRR